MHSHATCIRTNLLSRVCRQNNSIKSDCILFYHKILQSKLYWTFREVASYTGDAKTGFTVFIIIMCPTQSPNQSNTVFVAGCGDFS